MESVNELGEGIGVFASNLHRVTWSVAPPRSAGLVVAALYFGSATGTFAPEKTGVDGAALFAGAPEPAGVALDARSVTAALPFGSALLGLPLPSGDAPSFPPHPAKPTHEPTIATNTEASSFALSLYIPRWVAIPLRDSKRLVGSPQAIGAHELCRYDRSMYGSGWREDRSSIPSRGHEAIMQGGYNPQGGYGGAPGSQQPGQQPGGYGQPPGGYGQPQPSQLVPMPPTGGGPPIAVKKGFFGGLFDFSFNNFITPTLIKIIYGLSLLGIALFVLAGLIGGFISMGDSVLRGLGILVVTPIIAFLYLLMARVYTESMVVLFKVAENLQEINRKTRE